MEDLFWEYGGHYVYVEEIRTGQWEAATVKISEQSASPIALPQIRITGGPFRSRHEAGMKAIEYLKSAQ